MNKDGFRSFLQERNLAEEKIDPYISLAEKFEAFEDATAKGGTERAAAFSSHLIANGLNTLDNYYAWLLYGQFSDDDDVFIAAMEVLDGREAMDNLYARLAEEVGQSERDQVFDGIALPVLGSSSEEKAETMRLVMERMESVLGLETTKRILAPSLRTLPDAWYAEGVENFRQSKNIDEYLERKGKNFIAHLEQLKNDGKMFFMQVITDEVIEFVRSHAEIGQGVREGNIIYETKIPYMTREYLAETDPRMKAYYYCHCPWARESIRTGKQVSANFCNCSAGFHKRSWEMIFEQTLEAEVLETVLKGDKWCRFAIHLPEDAV